jgi:hypothetical protein
MPCSLLETADRRGLRNADIRRSIHSLSALVGIGQRTSAVGFGVRPRDETTIQVSATAEKTAPA